jgi:fructose-1,6-bisphosphatase-3
MDLLQVIILWISMGHDIVWMGAAAGNEACIANVILISLRYANWERSKTVTR